MRHLCLWFVDGQFELWLLLQVRQQTAELQSSGNSLWRDSELLMHK